MPKSLFTHKCFVSDCPPDIVDYVVRFLILNIDLEALLPTRRFFNTVLDDSHLVVRTSLAPLAMRPEGRLFSQLLEQVSFRPGSPSMTRT